MKKILQDTRIPKMVLEQNMPLSPTPHIFDVLSNFYEFFGVKFSFYFDNFILFLLPVKTV